MENTPVIVQIMGRDYRLTSTAPREHTQRAAAYVDRRMRELSAAGLQGHEALSVMTALQMADELLRAQDENTRLRRKLDELNHD